MFLTDRRAERTKRTSRAGDRGFTLIELLMVITILGIITAVVIMSIRSGTLGAESAACESERRVLANAAESYFAQFSAVVIPDAGGAEGYEQTLVDSQLLRGLSTLFDLDAGGDLVQVVGSACIV